MTVSNIGGTGANYTAAAAASPAKKDDGKSMSADDASTDEAESNASSPSTVVTLGNNLPTDIPLYTGKISSIPLSSLAAPQLFAKADSDRDGKINFKEFSEQLKRTGASDDETKTLFDSFKKSKDGDISLDDFVSGIVAANASGSSAFQNLYMTYVTDAEGKFDVDTSNEFMASGASVVQDYYTRHPEMQERN